MVPLWNGKTRLEIEAEMVAAMDRAKLAYTVHRDAFRVAMADAGDCQFNTDGRLRLSSARRYNVAMRAALDRYNAALKAFTDFTVLRLPPKGY